MLLEDSDPHQMQEIILPTAQLFDGIQHLTNILLKTLSLARNILWMKQAVSGDVL
jgi:hypothetical protein